MDRLFSPWRFAYVTADHRREGCVLCRLATAEARDDETNLILARGRAAYVVVNAYPYNTGHVMVAPYRHDGRLASLDASERVEVFDLIAAVENALTAVYKPDGLNVGINTGVAAGAGVLDHLHVHVVPRWRGDTNFMTVTAESRVLPESLEQTWKKLRGRI